MKHFLPAFGACAAAVSLLTASTLFAENPLQIPEVTQKITVDFKTPQAAKAANLTILPLPEGKKIAFTTRWDDTNMNAVKVAQVLKKHGIRGTFFITFMNHDLIRKLLAENGSFGAHTTCHVALGGRQFNSVFDVCARDRVQLEAASNSTVLSFVLPVTSYKSRLIETQTEKDMGKVLMRSGFMGSPEMAKRIERDYNLASDTFFTSHHFNGDDRESNPAKFEAALNAALKLLNAEAGRPDARPYLTLGTHPWHTESGLKNLDANLTKILGNPEWWYCIHEEYISYRYQFHHTAIRKLGVNGATATFELIRPKPADIGAAVPLSFAVPDGAVKWNGQAIAANAGFLTLPYPDSCKVPTLIEEIHNKDNAKDFFRTADSKKFPGVKAAVWYNEANNTLVLQMRNDSPDALSGIEPTVRLPLLWENGVIRLEPFDLQPGKEIKREIPLGKTSPYLEFREGLLYLILQMNFSQGAGRLYTTLSFDKKFDLAAHCPRNDAMVAGPLQDSGEVCSKLAALSDPKVKLSPLNDTEYGKWFKQTILNPMAPMAINMTPVPKNWRDFFKSSSDVKNVYCAAAYEFDSPKAGEAILYFVCNRGSKIFINGNEVKPKGMFAKNPVQVQAGRNRAIFYFQIQDRMRQPNLLNIGFSFGDNPRYEQLTIQK